MRPSSRAGRSRRSIARGSVGQVSSLPRGQLATTRTTLVLALLTIASSIQAAPPQAIKLTDPLPYGSSPIDYNGPATSDAIARLNRDLADGRTRLEHEPVRGYLKSVLEALDVPIDSQLLVYSKTAVNQRLIEPRRPRAVYFNDHAYVAWVPGGSELEVAAIDPLKGGMFYTLAQAPPSAGRLPQFHRKSSCLACHIGRSTLSVPGFMVRSFQVDRAGKPLAGYSRVTHATPLANRWGGWYVTGRHGRVVHLGNLVGATDNKRHRQDPAFGGNRRRLDVNLDDYLSRHSDLVAHLVFNHQLHGQNLLIRVGYEARLGRRSDAEQQLVRYLLFADEAPLADSVSGTTRFARRFARRGPRDKHGRSLRHLDLRKRLFRRRLSYLVDSPIIGHWPTNVRQRVMGRLNEILAGRDRSGEFDYLDESERETIRSILDMTKANLGK